MRSSSSFRAIFLILILSACSIFFIYYNFWKQKITTKKSDVWQQNVSTTTTPTSCPLVSPLLQGPTNITFEGPVGKFNWPPTLEETAREHMDLELGGYYPGPINCVVRDESNVAVIVPYRDRKEHLKYLLHHLHGVLQRQQIRYVIIVVEQNDDNPFNKAQMMNTAFNYVINTYDDVINCVVFHDVDMLGEDDRAMYKCSENQDEVVHLSYRLDKFDYKFCCGITIGGILAMRKEQFKKINGFSNEYFGWGGEDDDAFNRITQIGRFRVLRPSSSYYKFKMIKHEKDANNQDNEARHEKLRNWKQRQPTDGLNSLSSTLDKVVRFYTHTRLFVTPGNQKTGE